MATKIPKYVYDSLVYDAQMIARNAEHQVNDEYRDSIADAEEAVLADIDLNKHLKSSIKFLRRGSHHLHYTDELCGQYYFVVANATVTGKNKIKAALKKAAGKQAEFRDAKLKDIQNALMQWKLNLYNQLIEGTPIEMPNFDAIVKRK